MMTVAGPIPEQEPCGREDCRHPYSAHGMHGCFSVYSGPGPAIPDAVCTCGGFDETAFIDRAARIDVLRELNDELKDAGKAVFYLEGLDLARDSIERRITELEAK